MIAGLVKEILILWHAHPIGQGIGFVATACYLISSSQKDDRKLTSMMLLGSIFYALHYALLNAWSGAASFTIGVLRNIAALCGLITPQNKLTITVIFISLYAAVAVLTASNLTEIFPMIGSSLYVIALFNFSGILMRMLILCALGLFLAYALYAGSIAHFTCALFDLIITSITILRLLRERKSS